MTRKRYVSTDISTDSRIRKLAEVSEFAALLYTWMIPHAADDATIVGDPDELLMLVVPGFRWRTADDVATAVDQMVSLGLVRREGETLHFPEQAFYKRQSYITADRRGMEPDPSPAPPTTNGTAEHRDSAQTSATKNFAPEPAQKRTSVKSSSSFKSSSSVKSSPLPGSDGAREAIRRTVVDDEFRQTLEDEYCESLGSRDVVRDVMDHAMSHSARAKCTDHRAYLRNWVRKEAEKARQPRPGQGRPRPSLSVVDSGERWVQVGKEWVMETG